MNTSHTKQVGGLFFGLCNYLVCDFQKAARVVRQQHTPNYTLWGPFLVYDPSRDRPPVAKRNFMVAVAGFQGGESDHFRCSSKKDRFALFQLSPATIEKRRKRPENSTFRENVGRQTITPPPTENPLLCEAAARGETGRVTKK
jgi:hypothetical protein